MSQSPPTPTPPSNALSKRPSCRGRGEPLADSWKPEAQLQGGEALANLLTLDECGSLEQSSASAMVSLDFPFCVGENQFLSQERLPSTLRRPGEGEGQGGPAAALS